MDYTTESEWKFQIDWLIPNASRADRSISKCKTCPVSTITLQKRQQSVSMVIVWFAFAAIPVSRENTFRILSLSLENLPWYSFVSWSVLLRPCQARCSRSSKMMPQSCTSKILMVTLSIFANIRSSQAKGKDRNGSCRGNYAKPWITCGWPVTNPRSRV